MEPLTHVENKLSPRVFAEGDTVVEQGDVEGVCKTHRGSTKKKQHIEMPADPNPEHVMPLRPTLGGVGGSLKPTT